MIIEACYENLITPPPGRLMYALETKESLRDELESKTCFVEQSLV